MFILEVCASQVNANIRKKCQQFLKYKPDSRAVNWKVICGVVSQKTGILHIDSCFLSLTRSFNVLILYFKIHILIFNQSF